MSKLSLLGKKEKKNLLIDCKLLHSVIDLSDILPVKSYRLLYGAKLLHSCQHLYWLPFTLEM